MLPSKSSNMVFADKRYVVDESEIDGFTPPSCKIL
jgi:hypothetical protein